MGVILIAMLATCVALVLFGMRYRETPDPGVIARAPDNDASESAAMSGLMPVSAKESPAMEESPAEQNLPDGGEKLIALTFDDGPSAYTAGLLDILAEHEAYATFFVVGNRAEGYPETLRRMVEEGHEIGTHTYSHADLTKLDDIRDEILKAVDVVENAAGIRPTLIRPPGGYYNAEIQEFCAKNEQSLVLWSVDTMDWKSRDVETILDTAFHSGAYSVADGSIVLMHDIYEVSVEAVDQLLAMLAQEGYRFVTVSQLLTLRSAGAVPGEVYNRVT